MHTTVSPPLPHTHHLSLSFLSFPLPTFLPTFPPSFCVPPSLLQDVEDAFHKFGHIDNVWIARQPPGKHHTTLPYHTTPRLASWMCFFLAEIEEGTRDLPSLSFDLTEIFLGFCTSVIGSSLNMSLHCTGFHATTPSRATRTYCNNNTHHTIIHATSSATHNKNNHIVTLRLGWGVCLCLLTHPLNTCCLASGPASELHSIGRPGRSLSLSFSLPPSPPLLLKWSGCFVFVHTLPPPPPPTPPLFD
jgi:hypothetical protein